MTEEPEVSKLLMSKHKTGHDPEPMSPISYLHNFFPQISILVLLSSLLPSLQVAYLVKFFMYTLSHPSKLHTHPTITSLLSLSWQDIVAHINQQVLCDVIFWILHFIFLQSNKMDLRLLSHNVANNVNCSHKTALKIVCSSISHLLVFLKLV
jgi:hypothetical protein